MNAKNTSGTRLQKPSRLSGSLATNVASEQSDTSLQLALENDQLKKRRSAYVSALQDAGNGGDDVIGYARQWQTKQC